MAGTFVAAILVLMLMKRREFLKTTALAGLGLGLLGSRTLKAAPVAYTTAAPTLLPASGGAYQQPPLPYAYSALEPHIDAQTMEIHYTKHHAGYIKKLNDALQGTEWAGRPLEELLSNMAGLPEKIRATVQNQGGGAWNHALFWQCLRPAGAGMNEKVQQALVRDFDSFEAFKEQWDKAALALFGSGWVWLIQDQSRKLKIVTTANQDNPMMDVVLQRGLPLLGLDVWEHAYYLKYQNRRPEYVGAFWQVINWDFVASRML